MGSRRSMVVAALAAFGGCADDKSFALVSVLTTEGELRDVAQLVVDVRNEGFRERLFYPKERTAALRLDAATAVTFSVSFRTSHQGDLRVGVTPLNAGGLPLGYGTSTIPIDPGKVTRLTVAVARGALPPDEGDGGAGDGPSGDGISPADAGAQMEARLPCEPVGAPMCGPMGTCYVACRNDGTSVGLCTAAGTSMPGQTCTRNEDCVMGSQCFESGCGTPPIKTCLKFCKVDGDCGAGRCNIAVPCGQQQTGFRVCSQPCDPVGDGTKGCAAGLHCFLFEDENPDCDCRAATRTGDDGASCADSRNCLPGFICVSMGGGKTCRALCRLATPSCPAGRTCTKLVDPDFKVYGGCLPP